MAKTIEFKDTKIQCIVLTNHAFNEGQTGFSSNISYAITDSNGDVALHKTSVKFTNDANNENEKMSEIANTHLNAYLDEMHKLMVEREEL